MDAPVIISFQGSPDVMIALTASQQTLKDSVFAKILDGLVPMMDRPGILETKVWKTTIPFGKRHLWDKGYLVVMRPQHEGVITSVKSADYEKFLVLEANAEGVALHYNAHHTECPTVRSGGKDIYYPCFLQVEFAYTAKGECPSSRLLERTLVEI